MATFKLPRNAFHKNATLNLDSVINFPEVENFYPYIDIIHKFALPTNKLR